MTLRIRLSTGPFGLCISTGLKHHLVDGSYWPLEARLLTGPFDKLNSDVSPTVEQLRLSGRTAAWPFGAALNLDVVIVVLLLVYY